MKGVNMTILKIVEWFAIVGLVFTFLILLSLRKSFFGVGGLVASLFYIFLLMNGTDGTGPERLICWVIILICIVLMPRRYKS